MNCLQVEIWLFARLRFLTFFVIESHISISSSWTAYFSSSLNLPFFTFNLFVSRKQKNHQLLLWKVVNNNLIRDIRTCLECLFLKHIRIKQISNSAHTLDDVLKMFFQIENSEGLTTRNSCWVLICWCLYLHVWMRE